MADMRYNLQWWLTAVIGLVVLWYILSQSRHGPRAMFNAWSDRWYDRMYWHSYPLGSKTAGSFGSYRITGPPMPGPLPGGAEPPYPKMDSEFPPVPVPQ